MSINSTLINLRFDLEPPVTAWHAIRSQLDPVHTTYKGNAYPLLIKQQPAENQTVVNFTLRRNSRQPFSLKVPMSPVTDEVYLFNCTNENWLHIIFLNLNSSFSTIICNYNLSPISETKLRSKKGSLIVDLQIPQSGYALLRN